MAVSNAERFLAEAIQSILDQSLKDFEFIIVDYGSTDDSKAIVSSFAANDHRIRLIEIPPCVLPEARNAGCFQAQGKYIAVMDADDVSLSDRLRLQVEFLESHPQVALLGGAVEWMDSSGKPFGVHRHPSGDREIKAELPAHNVLWHPTTMMRKDPFAVVGGYRRAFMCSHDYDLALRFAEKYECANLEEIVLRYRVHAVQLTSDRHQQQTLCKLAAQVSASKRRKGEPDPLDGVREITSSALAAWGIQEQSQRDFLIADGHTWVRNLMNVGENAAALSAAGKVLGANLNGADSWQVSEIHLCVATIHWRNGQTWDSLIALAKAVRVRPVLIGRPLKSMFRRLKPA